MTETDHINSNAVCGGQLYSKRSFFFFLSIHKTELAKEIFSKEAYSRSLKQYVWQNRLNKTTTIYQWTSSANDTVMSFRKQT